MSKDLKRRGFRFVGSTICYAFMQATGMVNDHATACFRYREVRGDLFFCSSLFSHSFAISKRNQEAIESLRASDHII